MRRVHLRGTINIMKILLVRELLGNEFAGLRA